jgi:hypothetical protein
MSFPPSVSEHSKRHAEEQPSPGLTFPSSHCSPESTTRLPHCAGEKEEDEDEAINILSPFASTVTVIGYDWKE